MRDENPLGEETEQRLCERLATCLEAEAGVRDVQYAQMIEDFPELSEQLRDFIAGQAELERLTSPLRPLLAEEQKTTPGGHGTDTVVLAPSLPELADYALIEQIARGGMGVIYKARHKGLDRLVALKMIRSGDLATEDDVRRFQQEARRVAQLDHPNIVPVFEVGVSENRHFFTMRLMEGGSLAERISKERLSSREAADVIVQVARGVHHAHQRGVLHRDIKPANVLFDREGRPQIADFGLASPIDRQKNSRSSGAIVGTPMYMAPEQASRDNALTTAVDVYGLGAVLYELIASRPPFRADDPLSTLMQLVHLEPQRPRLLNPNADVDLETICLKCLDRDPERRYGSAEALADDLDRWLRNEPILARRSSPWRRAVKWAHRSPAVATLMAISSAAVIVCVVALIASNLTIAYEKEQTSQALEQRTAALEKLRALRAQEQRLAYSQAIALAERELLADNVPRAEQMLGECPLELRGWEWGYLKRSCHAELRSRAAPGGPTCLVYDSRDGRIYVGAGVLGRSGEIAVYDRELAGEPHHMPMHDDAVTALVMSRDGRRIASVSRDGVAHVCDTASGRILATFARHPGALWSVAFGPNGRRVVAGGDRGTITLCNADTGLEELSWDGHEGAVWSVAFSSDGRQIASAGADQTIKLWEANSGACLRTMTGHAALVRGVAYSPDGGRLVSAAYDNTARIWDVATGRQIATLAGHKSFVTRAKFSPDGQRVVTASTDGTLCVWDAESAECLLLLHGHGAAVWDVEFSPDGREVASVGDDGTVKLWTGTLHGMPEIFSAKDRWIQRAEWSRDGTRLAILDGNGSLSIWDATSDTRRCAIPGSFNERDDFSLSADGSQLVTADWQAIRVFDSDVGNAIAEIPRAASLHARPGYSAAGGFLAVAHSAETVGVWDIARAEKVRRFAVRRGPIAQLSLSQDGTRLAVLGSDEQRTANCITLWDIRDGAQLGEFRVLGSQLSWSPRGNFLAVFGESSAATIWNTQTGKQESTFETRAGPVRAVAFAPGGQRLFTASDDGTVSIWDMHTGRPVLSLRNATDPIDALMFVDDHTLLAANRFGITRRWSAGPIAKVLKRP